MRNVIPSLHWVGDVPEDVHELLGPRRPKLEHKQPAGRKQKHQGGTHHNNTTPSDDAWEDAKPPPPVTKITRSDPVIRKTWPRVHTPRRNANTHTDTTGERYTLPSKSRCSRPKSCCLLSRGKNFKGSSASTYKHILRT